MPGKTNPRYLAVDGFKLCNVCETVKPVSEFFTRKGAPDGYRNDCRACVSERSAGWYSNHRERAIEAASRWARENPERVRARYTTDKYRESARAYRGKNRDRINGQMRAARAADRDRFRRYNLKRRLKKYGVTLEEYEALLESQGGVCAICQGPPNGKDDDIYHADHDHKTGELRGLLCSRCNNGLGCFSDKAELLQIAIAYLARPPFRPIAEGTLF